MDTHDHVHGVSVDTDRRALGVALGLIVGFMAAEVVAGILTSSLALLSDAAHMLTDAAAIALSLVAARLAQRPAAGSMTYGLGRGEILSAQLNGVTLLVLAALIAHEAIGRLVSPLDVDAPPVLVVALVGLAVNAVAARVLAGANRQSLNVEGPSSTSSPTSTGSWAPRSRRSSSSSRASIAPTRSPRCWWPC